MKNDMPKGLNRHVVHNPGENKDDFMMNFLEEITINAVLTAHKQDISPTTLPSVFLNAFSTTFATSYRIFGDEVSEKYNQGYLNGHIAMLESAIEELKKLRK